MAIAVPSAAALRTNVVERSYDRFGRLRPWLTDASANAAARAALDAAARLMSSDGRALARIADVVAGDGDWMRT